MAAGGDEEIPAEEQSAESLELPADLPADMPLEELAEPAAEGAPEVAGETAPEEEPLDPDLSVEDLLTAALTEEAALPASPAEGLAPSLPGFQLRIRSLSEGQRAAFKKVLEGQAVAETSFTGTSPVISQLTEYQAIQLLQAARQLGIQAQCAVSLPDAAPSEDELALGDLSAISEEQAGQLLESAPSVVLPKGEKDVMLCSPTRLPQSNILETFGIVIAHRSIARRMFREAEMREKLERELLLNTMPHRQAVPLPSSHLQQVLREIMLELRKGALAKGANAVLGVKIEAFPESSTLDPQLEQLRLVAFGTAAVVEKA